MENLRIDQSINQDLRKAAGWIKFLAILLYISMGFCILGTLVSVIFASALSLQAIVVDIFFGAVAVLLCYFPASYAMNFSTKIKQAIGSDNQQNMQEAFSSLGSYFKFYGIFNIVMLAFIVLGFIFSFFLGVYFFSETAIEQAYPYY